MKLQTQGFTLVELLIVVAILGVLVAIALPAYQDFVARSQAAEAVEVLSGFKTSFAEFRADKGHWPITMGGIGEGKSIEGTITGKYLDTIEYTSGPGATTVQLTATMKTSLLGVNGRISGATVLLESDDGENWACKAGTMNTAYLPGACR